MGRKQFSDEEKRFFRERFPRFSLESLASAINGRKAFLTFHPVKHPLNALGSVLEFDDSIWVSINARESENEQRVTILHELLHLHYGSEGGFGYYLYKYLIAVYGRNKMSPLSFLPGHGEIYYQHWEDFLDEEAYINEENSGLVDKARKFFHEDVHYPSWKKIIVECMGNVEERWFYA